MDHGFDEQCSNSERCRCQGCQEQQAEAEAAQAGRLTKHDLAVVRPVVESMRSRKADAILVRLFDEVVHLRAEHETDNAGLQHLESKLSHAKKQLEATEQRTAETIAAWIEADWPGLKFVARYIRSGAWRKP